MNQKDPINNLKDIEENPFGEDQIKCFDSHQIVIDLSCVICTEIAVQANECIQCSSLFCKKCEVDWRKKSTKCPNCNANDWKLKEPHKVYKNLLSRLQFKCSVPNCIELYTIDTFKSHEHKYLADNQIIVEFFLRDSEGVVQDIDQAIGKQLEINYQAKKKFVHYLTNKKFEFDFSDQKNLVAIESETKEKYSFIRRVYDKPIPQKKYKWVWYDNDKQKWIQYSNEHIAQLDNYYQDFAKNPDSKQKYMLKFNNAEYQYNFCDLTQTRVSTNYKRGIFRCPVIQKMRFSEN